MKIILVLTFLTYFRLSYATTYNIANCTYLQDVSIYQSGATNVFNFTQDIDCTGIAFTPLGIFQEVPLRGNFKKYKFFFRK